MMGLRGFDLLTDENVHPDVVHFFRKEGFDVLDVSTGNLAGKEDRALLQRAFSENRVLVTHDRDFGQLVFAEGVPFIGVLYLRPGHIDPAFTVETLRAVMNAELSLDPPFLLVAEQTNEEVRMRLRHLGDDA
ncbi:MAG: hypothetical protein BRD38_02895 [Bacteroidetes bacterium QH_9_67_14]|nr:MAG: hypothetical protein BRD38_02895 [Bacteroidetes bacterium QH_9_67_14]